MSSAPKIPADETLRGLLKAHLDDHDLIANLASFGRRMHFMKAFAHYEVFKLIEDMPGDIVECGVYKGASLLTFARFLETFSPGDRTRKVLGFAVEQARFNGLQTYKHIHQLEGGGYIIGEVNGGIPRVTIHVPPVTGERKKITVEGDYVVWARTSDTYPDGIDPDEPLDTLDPATMIPLAAAISRVENGTAADRGEIERGWALFSD